MQNIQIIRNLTVVGVLLFGICVAGSLSFAAPKAKIAAKQKIPTSIMLENKRSSDLTNFSIYESGNDKAISSIKKPLASNKKLSLSLKGLKTCNVTLSGTFADDSDASGEVDICAEKIIRLID
jgi:hypothetical protein